MNQKVQHDIKDTWFCLSCGEKIIPFEKGGKVGFVEPALFFFGLAMAVLVSIYLGIFLMVLAAAIMTWLLGNKKKVCPSCENVNIVPATSPVAQKFVKS